jgi:hypothetical protein
VTPRWLPGTRTVVQLLVAVAVLSTVVAVLGAIAGQWRGPLAYLCWAVVCAVFAAREHQRERISEATTAPHPAAD